MWPPANTITISADPIPSGASAPGPASLAAMPIANRNRNVPMNSTVSFLSRGGVMACCFDGKFRLPPSFTPLVPVRTGGRRDAQVDDDGDGGRGGGGNDGAGRRAHVEGGAGVD